MAFLPENCCAEYKDAVGDELLLRWDIPLNYPSLCLGRGYAIVKSGRRFRLLVSAPGIFLDCAGHKCVTRERPDPVMGSTCVSIAFHIEVPQPARREIEVWIGNKKEIVSLLTR
jgi:hypothetical protein